MMFALGESNQEWVEWRLAHNSFDSAILIAREQRSPRRSPAATTDDPDGMFKTESG